MTRYHEWHDVLDNAHPSNTIAMFCTKCGALKKGNPMILYTVVVTFHDKTTQMFSRSTSARLDRETGTLKIRDEKYLEHSIPIELLKFWSKVPIGTRHPIKRGKR